MQSITEIIQPIKLLAGSHPDTATTGSGCFLNVIAYLNGEPQITDESPCVCVTARKIAIWLNDWLKDDERHEMIPFIERAMGSATDDRQEMNRRLKLMVEFANKQRDMAATAATYTAKAATTAATYAANAATYAAKAADDAATYAANAATTAATYAANAATAAADAAAMRKKIKAAAFEYLDAVLPKPQARPQDLIQRAQELICIAEAA